MEIFSILGIGLLLGFEHSLDADHVVAIATISSKSSSWKKALAVGAYWGIGHTAILLLVGSIILNVKTEIPRQLGEILEGIVGFMLIFLGIKNLMGYKNEMLHAHGEKAHIHTQKMNDHHERNHPQHPEHFSFWIGAIHGLAGSAVLTLIILTTIQSKILGIVYITIFGLGSILGMATTSLILQIPTVLLEKKFPQRCAQFAGGLSTILGMVIILKLLL